MSTVLNEYMMMMMMTSETDHTDSPKRWRRL